MPRPVPLSEIEPNDGLDGLVAQALAFAPRRGRSPGPAPSVVREIGPEDLAALTGPRALPQARPLERLRTTHHLAARFLAEGRPVHEVALATGYSPQRISDLQGDPAFVELVAHYRSQVDAKWLNVQERLAALGFAVTEEMQERLAAAPESFTNEELRRWAETLLDRAGHGPTATRNVNVDSRSLTLNLIEKIKAEAQSASEVKLLTSE